MHWKDVGGGYSKCIKGDWCATLRNQLGPVEGMGWLGLKYQTFEPLQGTHQ